MTKTKVAISLVLILAFGGFTACQNAAEEETTAEVEGEQEAKKQEEEVSGREKNIKEKKEKEEAMPYDERLANINYEKHHKRSRARRLVREHVPELLAAEKAQLKEESPEEQTRRSFEKSIDGWISRVD